MNKKLLIILAVFSLLIVACSPQIDIDVYPNDIDLEDEPELPEQEEDDYDEFLDEEDDDVVLEDII